MTAGRGTKDRGTFPLRSAGAAHCAEWSRGRPAPSGGTARARLATSPRFSVVRASSRRRRGPGRDRGAPAVRLPGRRVVAGRLVSLAAPRPARRRGRDAGSPVRRQPLPVARRVPHRPGHRGHVVRGPDAAAGKQSGRAASVAVGGAWGDQGAGGGRAGLPARAAARGPPRPRSELAPRPRAPARRRCARGPGGRRAQPGPARLLDGGQAVRERRRGVPGAGPDRDAAPARPAGCLAPPLVGRVGPGRLTRGLVLASRRLRLRRRRRRHRRGADPRAGLADAAPPTGRRPSPGRRASRSSTC